MKRSKKRTLLMVLLLLTGGAIINVAVAWAFVWKSWPMFADGIISPPADVKIFSADEQNPGRYSFWRLSRCDRLGATRYQSFWTAPHASYGLGRSTPSPTEFLFPWAAMLAPWTTELKDELFYRGSDARGWPMLSMYAWWDGTVSQSGSEGDRMRDISFAIGELHLGSRMVASGSTNSIDIYDARVLPLGIIWPGFAINTVFYAAVLWVLFAAPGAVRRFVRRRRGRCTRCGYDLRGHALAGPSADLRCPECGRLAANRSEPPCRLRNTPSAAPAPQERIR
jgi:hypothetical protein